MTLDEIECIEEGGTEPTIALLRRLAAALDADVRLTAGHELRMVRTSCSPTSQAQPFPMCDNDRHERDRLQYQEVQYSICVAPRSLAMPEGAAPNWAFCVVTGRVIAIARYSPGTAGCVSPSDPTRPAVRRVNW
jgi:hypothetical protein